MNRLWLTRGSYDNYTIWIGAHPCVHTFAGGSLGWIGHDEVCIWSTPIAIRTINDLDDVSNPPSKMGYVELFPKRI